VYHVILLLHSWVRWAVVALGVLAVVAAFRDGAAARRRVLPFVVALDLQLLMGLALYLFLSPLTRGHGGGAALRYWRAEHPALALVAVLVAHAGSLILKRPGKERPAAGAVLLAAALVLVLVTVPWARPLLRH
jgi:predicted Co/Zn/Cd cation transporter (cation efflux family)